LKKATLGVKPGKGWFIIKLGNKPGETQVVSPFFKHSFNAFDWAIENGYDTEWWATQKQKRNSAKYRESRRKFVKMQDLPLFSKGGE
jgi:hypothetical protein